MSALIAFIKKLIPVPVKAWLKSILITPQPQAQPGGSANSHGRGRGAPPPRVVAGLRMRPCASKWPGEVCECDMHLGAFRLERIREKLLRLLDEASIAYVDDVGEDGRHIAVPLESLEAVRGLLDRNGFLYEHKEKQTSINDYDFPTTREGARYAELVPATCAEIRVYPPYFCKARKEDARALSILVSTFNDTPGARLFHSTSATVRMRTPAEKSVGVDMGSEDPIDVVVTTVDSSDPVWLEKFNTTLKGVAGEIRLSKTTNAARFTSHDELRFVLRSIYYYAPYVRTIHIVTDAQCPEWLDTSHPRIRLVDHRDIIDPQYLPTFNSDAIESCLWRIPGLAERFVYFNDDMLLMSPTTRSTFYTSNGLPRFFASPRRIPEIPAEWAESYTLHAHLQSSHALQKRGYPKPRIKFQHVPYAAKKSILLEMEGEFREELHRTRCSPFRSEASYATISFLYPNYALVTGRGVLSEIGYQYVDVSWPDWRERLLRACRRTDITVACINESHDALEADALDAELSVTLSARFPCVAPWERSLPAAGNGGRR